MSRCVELQVLFCGVGGQGVLRAAEVLGRAVFAAGRRVNIGQIHGMSQRGGSVSSFVLVGEAEAALLDGPPDVVVALEPLEAARAAATFGPATTVLLNQHPVVPYERTRLGQGYPETADLLARIAARAGRVLLVDATAALVPLGLERAVGVAMLGALSRLPALGTVGLSAEALGAALGGGAEAQRAWHIGRELPLVELARSAASASSPETQAQGTRHGLQARH